MWMPCLFFKYLDAVDVDDAEASPEEREDEVLSLRLVDGGDGVAVALGLPSEGETIFTPIVASCETGT